MEDLSIHVDSGDTATNPHTTNAYKSQLLGSKTQKSVIAKENFNPCIYTV